MHTGGASLDHCFHQFEGIQAASESGFGIGHDGGHPVHAVLVVHVMDLVGAQQRIIDPPDHRGHAVRRIQTLVGIHVAGVIRIRCHLPAAEIDRLQPGLHLLHRLIAGEGAEGWHILFVVQQPP